MGFIQKPLRIEIFIRRVEGFGVPIQYGIVILKSPKMAPFVNEHISGITVPQAIIAEMDRVAPEGYKDKAAEITARLLREISPMVQGVHFMPLGWSDLVPPLTEGLPRTG